LCQDFSTGGAGGALDGAMTLSMSATSTLTCYGSMTFPATNFSASGTIGCILNFWATTTGKTFTTNGVTLSNIFVVFDGVGGEWTLGSALTISGTGISFLNGSFLTGNYNITATGIQKTSAGTITVSLGSSTLALSGASPITFTVPSGLTLNAGTSQINCSGANPVFTGGGLTFYNVQFGSSAATTTTINGANTFNNLTQVSRAATGIRNFVLGANQTVSGTLTLGAANTAIRRIRVYSDTIGTQRTITLNGTLATLADVDFKDIVAAGSVATPWTGTRIGTGGNISGITADTPKTVYWNLAGSQNWSATAWATTNNGVPAVNNFPLPQDTATFTEAGSAGTVTIDAAWWIGSIQMADGVSNRTTAFTLATAGNIITIYKDVTFFSSLTLSGTGNINFWGTSTQNITSAGITWTQPITVNVPSTTFKIVDNLTSTGTSFFLTAGTLDLNNNTLTCVIFQSNNINTRSIAFGTGNITLTGNNATIWVNPTATNFSYTGTPTINSTYSGSTGTRTIQAASTTGGTESNAISFVFNAGTDGITFVSTSKVKNLTLTGWAGSLLSENMTVYGNYTLSSGTISASTSTLTFAATSGTQQITTAGVTLDRPITFNGIGGTFAFQDALTQGSTRAFTLTNGTLQFKNGTTNVVGSFQTSGTNIKFLQSTSAGSQATISQASGTVNGNYMNIKDSAATGGAAWYAGINSVNSGNNTGWVFNSPTLTGNFFFIFN
jgi:hypothetical protein